MKTRPAFLFRSLTHISCLCAGLLLGMVFWKAGDNSTPGDPTATEAGSTRTSDRRRIRDTATTSGSEILGIISPQLFNQEAGQRPSTPTYNRASYLEKAAEGILKAADDLEPAGDIPAAAISAIEKYASQFTRRNEPLSPEDQKEAEQARSRFIHWMRQDPAAALAHISQVESTSRTYFFGDAVYAAMKEQGIETAIQWLNNHGASSSYSLTSPLASLVASSGDPANLALLHQSLSPAQWNQTRHELISSWPFDKADDFFNYAINNNLIGSAANFASRHGQQGADWFLARLADENLDPGLKDRITNSPDFHQLLRNNSHLPLDLRLEYLQAAEPNRDPEELALMVGGNDVLKAFSNTDTDLRYLFRHGKVTFEEVVQSLSEQLPELASKSPDAIRLQILKELAEENGPAALQALEHTPEPDKWTLALKPVQWNFYNVNPQDFYDYLQHIPYQEPEHFQARFASWVSHSSSNLSLYSRDYTNWVKALPQGIDREMAAIGILRILHSPNTQHPDRQLIAEMDALVQDPALRQRIQAPAPTK